MIAKIAQLAEHVIGNDEVPGSIPGLGFCPFRHGGTRGLKKALAPLVQWQNSGFARLPSQFASVAQW